MIAHLRGRLLSKHPNQAIVDCTGVGYDVIISVETYSGLPDEGSDVSLFIHTHVREDAIALFGFRQTEEKRLFEKLISVNGIGPTLAVKILSGMSAHDLISSLRASDFAKLTKVPGVGRKTAERMVLELKDKLDEFVVAERAATPAKAPTTAIEEDVVSALVNLGYQQSAAEKALETLKPTQGKSFEQLFRAAMSAIR